MATLALAMWHTLHNRYGRVSDSSFKINTVVIMIVTKDADAADSRQDGLFVLEVRGRRSPHISPGPCAVCMRAVGHQLTSSQ